MAGLIRRDDIDEVRTRVSIVEVVGDHVSLKPAGVGSLKGLCPFHDERTPSFHVRPAIGRYHCFGCGEDGDVFGFAMAMDHTTFQETVERFAAQVGVTLRYEDGGPHVEAGSRLRLLDANKAAAAFFEQQLATSAAEPGQRFLGERGFDFAAAKTFGVGFAPKSFDALRDTLRSQGFRDEELLAAGLLSEGQRGAYDRFRGRLVWPIRDVTGAVIGFGARKLLEDDQGPKYLNTPETPIFHKSQVLYGLDIAKREIAKSREAVIVEGYTDVMACHLAGVTTAVATCGTAFGVDHIKVLRRVLGDFSNSDTRGLGRVIFTFDPDEAGQKAASRAFAEEQRFAAQTFVAVAPEGLDPCDLRLQRGDGAVRRLVAERRPLFEFMLRRVVDAHDLETVEGRVQAIRQSVPILASIRDKALLNGYERTVAGWLGVDPREVNRAVASFLRRTPPAAHELQQPGAGLSIASLGADPVTVVERDAVCALLQQGALAPEALRSRAARAYVDNPSLRIIRDGILAHLDLIGQQGFSERVAAEVPEAMASLVRELAMAPMVEGKRGIAASVQGLLTSLIQRDILREKGELIAQHQRIGQRDPARAAEIRERLTALDSERAALEAER